MNYQEIHRITQESINKSLNLNDKPPYELWEQTVNNLKEQNRLLEQLQEDSFKNAKTNNKRFIIQTVLSVLTLLVSLIASVAAIISLFQE